MTRRPLPKRRPTSEVVDDSELVAAVQSDGSTFLWARSLAEGVFEVSKRRLDGHDEVSIWRITDDALRSIEWRVVRAFLEVRVGVLNDVGRDVAADIRSSFRSTPFANPADRERHRVRLVALGILDDDQVERDPAGGAP